MRVAWFAHRYYPFRGGSENFVRAMTRRQVATGHAVDVITSDAYDLWYFTDSKRQRVTAPRIEWVDGARVRRIPVRHVPGQRYLGRLLSYAPHWPTRCRFASYMPLVPGIGRIRERYDVVAAIGFPYTAFAYGALRTARKAGAPLVVVPFLHLSTPGDVIHRGYTLPHQQRLLREADCVVVQTELEADTIASFGVPRKRVLKLGMAVEHDEVIGGDRSRFRGKLGIGESTLLVGQLGACDENKGTCDLVRAVARLNEQRPASNSVHLVLAGSASPSFERFVAEQGPAAWLHRLGIISDEARRGFYAGIDVFAMPSRTDSFGIVFLEAWANGLPVIAADAGGVSEVVAHNQRGLLVSFGDVQALTQALSLVLVDRELARRLGRAGRSHVSDAGFTWDSRYRALADRIASLVSEPPRPWPGPHHRVKIGITEDTTRPAIRRVS